MEVQYEVTVNTVVPTGGAASCSCPLPRIAMCLSQIMGGSSVSSTKQPSPPTFEYVNSNTKKWKVNFAKNDIELFSGSGLAPFRPWNCRYSPTGKWLTQRFRSRIKLLFIANYGPLWPIKRYFSTPVII